ncbi:MAG TPA: TonB-dependent siderophore receptor, partial [Acidobacteriaceae bacterium]|nr:TonB-dependent siderophore receptor [Acidobacteriaceae bacterium]
MKARRGSKKRNQRQGKAAAFMGGRAWLAVGTIAAYAAAGGASKSALLHASPAGARQQETQAQLTVRRFDIPAGPLDSALAEYAKECGLTVGFTIPKETLPGFRSRGV